MRGGWTCVDPGLPGEVVGHVELGLDALVVSLDGLQPVHDRIRGEGVFRRAVDGILLARCLRQTAGGHGPVISINYCLTDCNYDCLVEFAELMLETVGVDRIRISHLNYVTRRPRRRG